MCATPAPVVGYIVPAPSVFSVASAPGENPSASGYVIAATPAVSSVGPAPPWMLRAKRRWLCCLFQTMAVGVFRCCSPTSHCCVSASQHLRSLGRFSRHEKLGERSRFPRLLLQRANSAPAQCRAGRRIPIASSRCRQRQRRACDLRPRSSLKRSFWGGLEWSSNFDTSCAERQIPGCARLLQRKQLVSGAAQIRSSLRADKRGRSQVFDSILEGASKLRYVQPVLTFCLPANGSFASPG